MGVAACGQQVDNSGTTLQKLFQLYRQADLCDVQLQVGVRLFHAHRLILSMSSDVFKTMLTDAKWPDARKARIVLNEEPECVKVCSGLLVRSSLVASFSSVFSAFFFFLFLSVFRL